MRKIVIARALFLVTLTLSLTPLAATSENIEKLYRIGVLTELSQKNVETWRTVLLRRGYVEGKNVILLFRTADGNFDLLGRLARDLVEERVDVILTLSTPPAIAARQATRNIPIVTISSDPVGAGLIESFARPGGNVTGLYVPLELLASKRLQLLKETVPGLSSVAVLWNPNNPPARRQLEATEEAARSLGIRSYAVGIAGQTDLKRALQMISAQNPSGLIIMQDPVTFSLRQELAEFSLQNRLPASHAYREFVDAGGLMSYGFSIPGLWEAAAQYADKILKGTRPEDLPMEEPTRVELAINLSTAKALRLRVPESILLRADEVIR